MHKIITFIESESEILAVKCYAVLCSVVSDSLWPHGLQPARLLGPWESPGKTTGVVCKALLQGIFPTQGLNPGFSHCKQILHHLSYKGSPVKGSVQFSSVQFSLSVVSDSLRPHESQHARPPCPSPTPGVYPNSCPSSQWCHPAISSCHLLLLPPPIPLSIRVFSNESTLRMRWPKYWSFSFSISPSNVLV